VTTVLKLGGSVVTEKDTPETVAEDALDRAAAALDGREDLVLVHGGGSFGHPAASSHAVSSTAGTGDPAAIRDVHDAMGRLNAAVLDALQAASVPALPVRPLSVARRDAAGDLALATTAIEGMLDEGYVPVLHGDVVVHDDAGATILSGDELVVALARRLDADRVGVCSTVPGVLDDGAVVPEIGAWADAADVLGESDATDVTGGMAAKVRALLELAAPASVFGLDDLDAFLDGERVGTVVR